MVWLTHDGSGLFDYCSTLERAMVAAEEALDAEPEPDPD
jgi:hypothetical protein